MALRLSIDASAPADRPLLLAAEVVQAGGVIVYPTETLYGLGVNAWNPQAIRRVHAIKRRPENKPLLVIVHTAEAIRGLTDEISEAGSRLMNAFWPGPLTLLLRPAIDVPPELTRGSGRIGVRVPSSKLCLRLCELCGYPLTSTSANISGQPVPSTVAGIEQMLGPGVDMYLDGGIQPSTMPSTVVDASGAVPRLVREGAISAAQLTEVIPEIIR